MANYKKKKKTPLRSCKMCKAHKFLGNSKKDLTKKQLQQEASAND
jgi:hypothetical protein